MPKHTHIEDEEWRDIPGREGLYQVSNLGRVKSLDRFLVTKTGSQRKHKGKILKPRKNGKYGYLGVYLGRDEQRYVHRLVAEAFLKLEPGLEVDHLDGDVANNSVGNIRVMTHAENMRAQRDRKPLCQRGHKFSEHAFWNANGRRECGECRRMRDRTRVRR